MENGWTSFESQLDIRKIDAGSMMQFLCHEL